jgi:hypothetical protein
VLEGFAPNLNKKLHVGHLKNLVLANALSRLLQPCQPVAMLGASLGVLPGALEELHALFDLVGYHPQVRLDTSLPAGLVATVPGTGEYAGCRVWQGPLGPVVLFKADGTPTYAYHDLAYARLVKPDWYVTGCEQQGHFAALGLTDKHLAIGLVLGPDGKKVKSSSGRPLLAGEAFGLVVGQLGPTPEPKKVAWNILACSFLQTAEDLKKLKLLAGHLKEGQFVTKLRKTFTKGEMDDDLIIVPARLGNAEDGSEYEEVLPTSPP